MKLETSLNIFKTLLEVRGGDSRGGYFLSFGLNFRKTLASTYGLVAVSFQGGGQRYQEDQKRQEPAKIRLGTPCTPLEPVRRPLPPITPEKLT